MINNADIGTGVSVYVELGMPGLALPSGCAGCIGCAGCAGALAAGRGMLFLIMKSIKIVLDNIISSNSLLLFRSENY